MKYENYFQFQKTINGFIQGYGSSGYVGHVVLERGKNPNTREFISGISPNIIHSMDAAQLAMTCVRHNGTFAGIHDSFSTHACDVEDLLQTSKEVFIELYEDGTFLEQIKSHILSDEEDFDNIKPENGCLDLDLIYGSDGFFS